jgi:DNA phosphorothioation-dependent restriction protein DptG
MRQELFQVLEELSRLYPDWRFGQLVVNVANWASAETGRDAYDVEDAGLLAEARAHLRERGLAALPEQPGGSGQVPAAPAGISANASPPEN